MGNEDLASQPESSTIESYNKRDPTALVSVTTNFVRALQIAYHKQKNGEAASNIEVVFIRPRVVERARFHSKRLAEVIGISNEGLDDFEYECVFECEIPKECVIHRVPLSMMQCRGFDLRLYLRGLNAIP